MPADNSVEWLQQLGYAQTGASLHVVGVDTNGEHCYGAELDALLDPEGPIRAEAVFDVEGIPTVCFLRDDGLLLEPHRLDAIRRRIWNQNLVSVILVLGKTTITPVPVARRAEIAESLTKRDLSTYGAYSAADIQSGDIFARHPEWFKHEERVDTYLLHNLNEAVRQLSKKAGLSTEQAQELIGQLLFISYLEDRGIVSEIYRRERSVSRMCELVSQRDRGGIMRLLKQLKFDFNGDFLEHEPGEESVWKALADSGFEIAERFLSGEEISSGQGRFWGYDFSFLPVELISGIYESFLSEEREQLGAYYTPRNLAVLVIDQVFTGSNDLSAERVYDGACGSGIFLTTAFRRILTHVEAKERRTLSLKDRIELLQSCIFGSDISKTACQMTAFSLYLSLLERLQPADLAQLERGEGVKLPKLRGANLFSGVTAGDFFSPKNQLAQKAQFSIFISNPPWKEPKGGEESTADKWSADRFSAVRRQMAGAFAHRAVGCLAPGGKLCLILPVSLFLAPTSQRFVSEWLGRVQVRRIINFGDLRDLLFDRAHHACVVALGSPRPAENCSIPVGEEFEYWVPKADTSLALGRLTLRGDDRHHVQTQRVATNNQTLVTLSWGSPFDLALGARMRLRGRFDDMFNGRFRRWTIRKGVHLHDSSREKQSSARLRAMRFITVEVLQGPIPVLHASLLQEFPKAQSTVVGLNDDLLSVFKGPRVVFPDGPSPDLEVRAHFVSTPASFTSSVGVISGPQEDAELLRFVAVYLRSDLVRYFVVMNQYSVLVAQDRVTLKDLRNCPFTSPDHHPHPDLARKIVRKVATALEELELESPLDQQRQYERMRAQLQDLIFEYFGLTQEEMALVREIVQEIVPSIQPRGFSTLRTYLQHEAPLGKLKEYAVVLRKELVAWRQASGGSGYFDVTVHATAVRQHGRFAIVRVQLRPMGTRTDAPDVEVADRAVKATVRKLQHEGLLPMHITSNIYLAADVVILVGSSIYIIKPLQRRAWLRRSALLDAQRIVSAVQRSSHSPQVEAA